MLRRAKTSTLPSSTGANATTRPPSGSCSERREATHIFSAAPHAPAAPPFACIRTFCIAPHPTERACMIEVLAPSSKLDLRFEVGLNLCVCCAPESEALLFYTALPWFIGIAPRALFPSPRRSAAMQPRRCAPLLIARTNQTRKKPGLIIPAQSPSSARGLGGAPHSRILSNAPPRWGAPPPQRRTRPTYSPGRKAALPGVSRGT